MKNVRRYDNHKIGKNVKWTAQGFAVIPAFTARTGIQNYLDGKGGILKEYRPDDEVFSEKSMASLRTAPVTDGHPPVMVTPDNVDEYSVGHTNGIVTKEVIDGEKESFLGTHLVITHRDAIEAIKAGKAELSNGYNVDLEFSAGEHNGEKFDAIQRNITNNHIAIVWKGRAGKNASLKLDEDGAVLVSDTNPCFEDLSNGHYHMDALGGMVSTEFIDPVWGGEGFHRHKTSNGDFTSFEKNTGDHVHQTFHGDTGKPVKHKKQPEKKDEKMKIKINGKEFDVADELGNAIEAERKEVKEKHDSEIKAEKEKTDAETKKVATLETEKTTLEGKNDSLESDIKKLKENKTDNKDGDINTAVKERLNVMAVGKKMLDGETVKKLDSMSNEEIKKAVVKADSGLNEKDEAGIAALDKKLEKAEYVDARFDHVTENLDLSSSQTENLGNKIVKKREDGNEDKKYRSPDQVRLDNMKKTVEDSTKPVGRRLEK